jgi:predicted amidohydrolase YtcJ
MTREPADPLRLDYLIKAGAVHSMDGRTYRAVGLSGRRIAAVSDDPAALDDLVGPGTRVVDAGDLTLMPAFADSHEHLMEASRNTMKVPVERARSVADFTALVGEAARRAAPGEWVITSVGWHESNLAENRLPTLAELDAVAPDNPVLARRGGHLAVANTAALRAAGIDDATADPARGRIGRNPDGSRDGMLEGGAVYHVADFAPSPSRSELAAALGVGSAAYAALGVGTIREALIYLDEFLAYQEAWERGLLSTRVRPMIKIGGADLSFDKALDLVRNLAVRSGYGDDMLRLWGLKVVLDGGAEGAALEQPYSNDPSHSGHLNWNPQELTQVLAEAVRRGLRVGTHAVGDRAFRTLMDIYEDVAAQTGPLPPWTLVVEHGLLSAPEQRARAIRGGFGITVQHQLLWNMGSQMQRTWGPQRTRDVSPLDQWLAAGADLAAGSDLVRPVNPMVGVWGMVTRGTKSAGVQGPEHGIDVATAIRLYTVGTAALNHESDRLGTLAPGMLADLVAYRSDPLTADVDTLPELTPDFTVVDGKAVHDPQGRLDR